jgi:hypothetical protein
MIATKFEPTDARKAFPCFDEPQLKATYDFSIQHPVNTVALANFNVLVKLFYLFFCINFSNFLLLTNRVSAI